MLLSIYLNDHLGGSTAGRDLARRAAANNRGNPKYGPFLADLAVQVERDREALIALMRTLGVGVDLTKVIAGWAAEKLGRLKLNGRIVGYSPLSRLIELEGLSLGVHGKLAMWLALKELEPSDPRLATAGLTELSERAHTQLVGLEQHRLLAVAEALG